MPAKSRQQIMTQGKSRRQKIVMPGKSRQQKIYLADKLKNELAQIPFYPLTVVVSPSGFGKTTAVREYFRMLAGKNACRTMQGCTGIPA